MFKLCKSNAFFAKIFDKLRKSCTYLSIFFAIFAIENYQ
jgi:hypothetical protein